MEPAEVSEVIRGELPARPVRRRSRARLRTRGSWDLRPTAGTQRKSLSPSSLKTPATVVWRLRRSRARSSRWRQVSGSLSNEVAVMTQLLPLLGQEGWPRVSADGEVRQGN